MKSRDALQFKPIGTRFLMRFAFGASENQPRQPTAAQLPRNCRPAAFMRRANRTQQNERAQLAALRGNQS